MDDEKKQAGRRTRKNRQAEEDPWPEEDGGEGGAGGEGGNKQCAAQRRRLRMEQVARDSAEAVADEEQGTRRAPFYMERDRRTGSLTHIEYIWPLSDSEEHRLQGMNASQQWNQGTHNEQECLAEMVAEELEAFFGCWPMLLAVFDAQAGQGEAARGASLSALRRAEFLELIRLIWLAEAGAKNGQSRTRRLPRRAAAPGTDTERRSKSVRVARGC